MSFRTGKRRAWAWLLKVACAVLTCTLGIRNAHAGAWDQPPGHGELIVNTSLFNAWDQYGAKGARSPFGYAGRFKQIQVGDYIEVGLPKRFTLVANVPISYLSFRNDYNNSTGGRLGDLELGLRRRLNRKNSSWALSGQFTATAPLYAAMDNPAPGNHQTDLEGRLLVGRGSAWGERRLFWDGEAAYRARTGAPADQLRGDLTGGASVTPRVMVLGQFFSIKGLRNGTPVAQITNPNAQSDFDLYKVQGSLLIGIAHRARLQAGWGHTLAGRNTGRGGTYIIGLWQSF